MEEARRILRKAIVTFLRGYQCFTSTAVILVFPVSVGLLLCQTIVPTSPIMATIQTHLSALFSAAGLPSTSQLSSILKLKLSQTIVSFIFTLPLALTFLVFAKASVIRLLCGPSDRRSLYFPLLLTQLCSSLVVLSSNATAFSLLFISFNVASALGFESERATLCVSVAGAIVYSVILAQSLVVCNMAVIVSGVENSGGFLPILRACLLIRGKEATALSLALPTSILMAAVEALFHFRVLKPYREMEALTPSIVGEGLTIAYIYSLIVVLDITATCMFYKSCKMASFGSEMEMGCSCGGGFAREQDKKGGAAGTEFSWPKLRERP